MDPVWIGAGVTLLVAIVDGIVQIICQDLARKSGNAHSAEQVGQERVEDVAAGASREGAGEKRRLWFTISVRTGGGDEGGRGSQR